MVSEHTGRLPLLSVLLISAITLAYEILLMRLFSIIQWHHFAYMIISLALLGYGASGTVLSLFRRRLLQHFSAAYVINILLFALSAVTCYLLAQHLPFNPQEVLWDPRQPVYLLTMYALLSVPFFFSANAVALSLLRFPHRVSRLYGANLAGAGLGCIGIMVLLEIAFPMVVLAIIGSLGALCAVLAAVELAQKQRVVMAAMLIAIVLPLLLIGSGVQPAISPYKELPQALRIEGTQITSQRSSPLGLVSVLETGKVPLRHAPGLSVNAKHGPPPGQIGIFTDAGNLSALTEYRGNREEIAFLDQMSWAVPYHLGKPQQVLILGAGGGGDILQALYNGVPHIDAIELNPDIAAITRRAYEKAASDAVSLHVAEARGFVTGTKTRYDLIQVALLDTYSTSSAGLHALNESYLYTEEALQLYLSRLAPGGYLSISRWIRLPPRDTLKLFATAINALEKSGVASPGKQLILIRGWQTSTLLVKNGMITAAERQALRSFCAERAFDVAWYPGIQADEANRYNRLAEPFYYQGAQALLGPERQAFINNYKFNLMPSTDDQPYFFHFFKWDTLQEILALRGQGGMPLVDWGYLVLIGTLVQAAVLSLVLILLPLGALWRDSGDSSALMRLRVMSYFLAIGLGFMGIEIALIQKLVLFLHHPLYAVAVVLSAILIFAGFGSMLSKWQAMAGSYHSGMFWAFIGMLLLGGAYIFLIDPVFAWLMPLPAAIKITVAVLLIAPLAVCMGIPFPLAMASLGRNAPALMPWAWGINGCASVLGAVLATLLAVHHGFTSVLLAAAACYGMAVVSFPGSRRHAD
jgi:SAM-dependent methyltransferase